MALSGPVLLLASWLGGLLTLGERAEPVSRPLAYLLEPLRRAWREDRDGALLLNLGLDLLLLALLWGFVGGALSRLAAVDLTGRGREPGRVAVGYARGHLGALLGTPVLQLLSVAAPLGLAWIATLLLHLPGAVGVLLTPVAILLVTALALLAVVGGSLTLACGCLSRPAVAVDGADLFDALSRPYSYALGGLPRLLGLRLLFGAGVLLGSGWRLLRTVLAGLLAAVLLEATLGEERWRRLVAVLGALGPPADASRMGLTGGDLAAALSLGLCAVLLLMLWMADLASRLACARTAVYLLLRRAVERTAIEVLNAPPRERHSLSAEEAGFREVSRVGEA